MKLFSLIRGVLTSPFAFLWAVYKQLEWRNPRSLLTLWGTVSFLSMNAFALKYELFSIWSCPPRPLPRPGGRI